jgi:tetratricopeptide (TPR) repeat protein
MAPAPATASAPRPLAQPPQAAVEPARGQPGTAPALEKPVREATAARRAAGEPRIAVPEPEAPIRITTAKLRVDPSLTRAYDAVSSGDLGAARGEYEQLLKTEPKNGEALLGMATIAVRQGRNEQAEAFYVRALEADPKNALAQAGLISLNAQADPVQAESRLKSLLASQPEVAALHFALGNVYVRQARWNEAQQAFFKAFTLDAENPDYLFNLAISLDQLHQAKLAAQYYNQSLAAAAKRPYSFDRAQVSARLRDLQN